MDSYTGRDGLTHQFTKIDWDEKTKVGTCIPTAAEIKMARKAINAWRQDIISRILAIDPSLAGERYFDFVNRDFETKKITWQVSMIEDPSLSFEFLYDMGTILEKRAEAFVNNNLDLKTPQVKK